MAHFAASGASATLDRPIALHGMTLGGGFAFADGTNRIDLGRSGIRALDAASAKSYSIGVPVAAGVAQAWQFGTNTVTDFHRSVWLDEGAALTISGRGRANFRAPGRGTNGVVLAGCADQAAKGDGVVGAVYCYTNDVFGTGTLNVDTRRTQLRLVGDFTWNTPVVTHSDQNDWDQPVYFDGNITVDAEWRNTNKNTRLTFARGKRVVFNRTLKTSSACYCSASGSSGVAEIVFNAKLDVGDRFNVGNNMTFVLNMPTNRLNGNSGRVDGTIRCGVPYAIAEKNGAGNRTELFVYSTGVLDLNGHDQATGILCAMGNATGGTVTSAAPATLHLVDSYTVNNYDSWVKDASGNKVAVPGYTNTLVYAGRVTLSKEGFYTNRLTRASTTSGALVVTRGKMEFAPTASWTNASELVVSGTGAFALEARTTAQGAAFPRTLTVKLDPTATRNSARRSRCARFSSAGSAGATAAGGAPRRPRRIPRTTSGSCPTSEGRDFSACAPRRTRARSCSCARVHLSRSASTRRDGRPDAARLAQADLTRPIPFSGRTRGGRQRGCATRRKRSRRVVRLPLSLRLSSGKSRRSSLISRRRRNGCRIRIRRLRSAPRGARRSACRTGIRACGRRSPPVRRGA